MFTPNCSPCVGEYSVTITVWDVFVRTSRSCVGAMFLFGMKPFQDISSLLEIWYSLLTCQTKCGTNDVRAKKIYSCSKLLRIESLDSLHGLANDPGPLK